MGQLHISVANQNTTIQEIFNRASRPLLNINTNVDNFSALHSANLYYTRTNLGIMSDFFSYLPIQSLNSANNIFTAFSPLQQNNDITITFDSNFTDNEFIELIIDNYACFFMLFNTHKYFFNTYHYFLTYCTLSNKTRLCY